KWDISKIRKSNQKRQEAEFFSGDKAPSKEISPIALLPTYHLGRKCRIGVWVMSHLKRLLKITFGGDIMEEKVVYIGIDYHKNSFTAAFLDSVTGVLITKKYKEIKNFQEDILKYKKEGYKVKIAVETLTGVKHFIKQIREDNEVYLINTNKFKNVLKGVNTDKKSDRLDAETIAIYLEKGLLPTVYIPEEEIEILRQLLKARERYIDQRRSIMNLTHSLLLEYGIKIKNRQLLTEKGMKEVENNLKEIPLEIQGVIKSYIGTIKHLTEEIIKIEEIINQYVEKNQEIKEKRDLLRSIPGVGEITALTFISTIGDVERFENSRKVGAYIGLVPRIYGSGDSVKMGRITKRGDSTLRNKLLQAAISLLKTKKKNSLKEFFNRLIKSGVSKNKARIALARKLATVMFVLLKENRKFENYFNKNFATLTG
ncbi:IS110 family RNA-guided transposase, partial [Persephonella sp.]